LKIDTLTKELDELHQQNDDLIFRQKSTQEEIKKINQKGYAGYCDWRLPTLEEAMSLMEPNKNINGLFIDPIFASDQSWIWTSDQVQSATLSWVVGFNGGVCDFTQFEDTNYVRAVRSRQLSDE
jgi:hypothetical protein